MGAKQPIDWSQVADALARAGLYWLTTVRKDGSPHTTPLVGAWVDNGFVFCTGPEEQKAQNLAHSTAVTVTTGVNTWNDGLDVVVEGNAVRVTGLDPLTRFADAIREKYHGAGISRTPTGSVTPMRAGTATSRTSSGCPREGAGVRRRTARPASA